MPGESKLYLNGSPTDYIVVDVTQPYKGTALFLKKGSPNATDDDLIAILLDVNANDVQPNSINFEYAVAPQSSVFHQNGIDQFTTDAVEFWSVIDLDDAGNIYMAVRSPETISPNANPNCGCDLIVIKYDQSGNIIWQGNYGDGRWLSVGETSRVFDAVYDSGYFYLGIFKGNSNAGGRYQVAKIDASDGKQVGLYQYNPGIGVDNITGITHDNAGHIYLSGSSNSSVNEGPGPYFQKINQSLISSGSSGLIDWVDGGFPNTSYHEGHGGVDYMSTSSTPGVGLVANSGWYLIGPQNHHALWLRIWDDAGTLLRYVELTDADDDPGWAWQVRFDSRGFMYIAGVIHGPLADFPNLTYNGFSDIVVFKVDPINYSVVEATLIGTPWSDEAVAMVIENDELYIVGHTYGSLYASNPTPGKYADGFLVKLDNDLNEIANLQMGTEKEDHFSSVRVFNNEVYISGYTEGSFFESIDTNQYNTDAFLFKRDASTLLSNTDFPNNHQDIKVYPNPAQSNIYIDLGELHNELVNINIFNTLGQKVAVPIIENYQIDISNQPKGLYFIQFEFNESRLTKKVIKE